MQNVRGALQECGLRWSVARGALERTRTLLHSPGVSISDHRSRTCVHRSLSVCAGLLLLCASALTGCASGWIDHGDTYVGGEPAKGSSSKAATYSFGSPGSGWVPLDQKGAQVVWTNTDYPAVIHLDSQCEEHGDSSIEQFTDHLRIDFRDWKQVSQTVVPMVGRDAVRTVIIGTLDGQQQTQLDLVVLKKDGCLFDLQLLTSPTHYSVVKNDFDSVVAGFRFPVK